jgi:hypothetical protein
MKYNSIRRSDLQSAMDRTLTAVLDKNTFCFGAWERVARVFAVDRKSMTDIRKIYAIIIIRFVPCRSRSSLGKLQQVHHYFVRGGLT